MSFIGNIGKQLKELRVVFCQSSIPSQGARNFVGANYLKVKESHPQFPFIVRECQGVEPMILARYNYGIEAKEFVSGYSQEQIEELVKELVDKAESINKSIQI